jgi:hypothetical protein
MYSFLEKCQCPKPVYRKTTTGGNDPNITQSMRYSQIVRTSGYSRVYKDQTYVTINPPDIFYAKKS